MPDQRDLIDPTPPDLNQQIAEAERELKMRHQVYPRLVANGKLDEATSEYRIHCMERIRDSLVLQRKLVKTAAALVNE